MSLNTYANLQTAITAHADDERVSDVVTDLITLAEADLNRRIKSRRKYIRSQEEIDEEFWELPTDFDSAVAMKITSTDPDTRLTFVDPEKAVELKSTTYTASGTPVHYSVVGDELELIPAPDSQVTVHMTYRQKIPALSDDQTTNWVLDDHPDAYLYGALLHAAPYLIDDPRLTVWSQLYERAIAGIEKEDAVSAFAGRLNARAKSFG